MSFQVQSQNLVGIGSFKTRSWRRFPQILSTQRYSNAITESADSVGKEEQFPVLREACLEREKHDNPDMNLPGVKSLEVDNDEFTEDDEGVGEDYINICQRNSSWSKSERC